MPETKPIKQYVILVPRCNPCQPGVLLPKEDPQPIVATHTWQRRILALGSLPKSSGEGHECRFEIDLFFAEEFDFVAGLNQQ